MIKNGLAGELALLALIGSSMLFLPSCSRGLRPKSQDLPSTIAVAAEVPNQSKTHNNAAEKKTAASRTGEGQKETTEAEKLYNECLGEWRKKNFKAAAKKFSKFQDKYPFSQCAARAGIMGAYCKYRSHQYDDAIDEFTIFAKLHPFHDDTPYAYYMIGLSHYERIQIVDRDQKSAAEAIKAFQTVLERFPNCDYAKDATFKIDFIKDHMAAKEMQVGRFYQQEKSWIAAIDRFKNVVTTYQTTEQTPEALFRLMECYMVLNMRDEFFPIWSILKLNHAKTPWCARAAGLVEKFK
ncbi:MAG: outer membrane protein assembly factor BamD [Holosporales bacterium]|jgi:outer membrane protein assembly factor BamD|nr:outer membrane protein assembly factor BamD [Holosporales bacterium]